MSKHERLRWQKSAEHDWDVHLVVVEEQDEAHQACQVQTANQKEQGQTNRSAMSFESLNVRLTRSNPTIPWGFELQQRGNDIIVSKIEVGSMAEKAGILRGDTVYEILNQKAGNLSGAQGRIQNALEITMTLKRPIKDSPSMSWAFKTMPSGQLAVEEYGRNGQIINRSDPQTKGFINSFVSELNTPEVQKSSGNMPYNTTTHKAESNSNWKQDDGDIVRHYESKRSYTRTESSNFPPEVANNVAMFNGTQPSTKPQQIGVVQGRQQQNFSSGQTQNLGGQYTKTTNTISQNYVSEERDRPQRSQSQDNKPQNYPQFPQNQYNDQLKNVQMSQKSTVTPGGIDYTSKGQTIQNGTVTQQSKFSGSYAQNGTSQPPKTMPKSAQQGMGAHTYQLNQYDQTDTINFPAAPQKGQVVSGANQQRGQQASNMVYQQKSNQGQYYGSGQQAYQTNQTNQAQYHSNQQGHPYTNGGHLSRQQENYQQKTNHRQYYGNEQMPQQMYQQKANQGQYYGNEQVSQQGQYYRNEQRQQQFNQGQYNANQQGQPHSGGAHLSRQARFNQENEGWGSQTLDRGSQRSRTREMPRRTRSQPRCCSRSENLPGHQIFYCPPHPRTYRELSPSARVRHLQYNTPLDLYSDEAASEAYRQHTGQQLHFYESNAPIPSTAYLQSETRRLVEEQDMGLRPLPTGPIQSASLKRIANAVGVPLD